MLSKPTAFEQTRATEEKEIEDVIKSAIASAQYQAEILNLTEFQKSVLNEAGYKLDYTANKTGYLWRINWEQC